MNRVKSIAGDWRAALLILNQQQQSCAGNSNGINPSLYGWNGLGLSLFACLTSAKLALFTGDLLCLFVRFYPTDMSVCGLLGAARSASVKRWNGTQLPATNARA